MELYPVHRENGSGLGSEKKTRMAGRELFQCPNARVHSLDDGRRSDLQSQLRNHCPASRVTVHCLSENLDGDEVVIAVDNQSGQKVGLAEDETVSVGVSNHEPTIGLCLADAPSQ